MIVVSNTSPLHYLILVDAVHVLPALYGDVIVPPEVVSESLNPHTPPRVSAWFRAQPPWLRVLAPARVDPEIRLHPGEAQTIALAEQLKANRLLIDDKAGRRIALQRGLRISGTLGVLDEAAARQLVRLRQTLELLRTQTNFRVTAELCNEILAREELRSRHRRTDAEDRASD
jgi:predicted nucleic acid-binding protein